jgi:hypothetical protein
MGEAVMKEQLHTVSAELEVPCIRLGSIGGTVALQAMQQIIEQLTQTSGCVQEECDG